MINKVELMPCKGDNISTFSLNSQQMIVHINLILKIEIQQSKSLANSLFKKLLITTMSPSDPKDHIPRPEPFLHHHR